MVYEFSFDVSRTFPQRSPQVRLLVRIYLMTNTSLRQPQKLLSRGEFVVLLALMISLLALSIDAVLPALPQMADDLDAPNPNDQQMVITALFLGLGVAQIFFGPLSDSFGRKPAIYIGYTIFVTGTVMCYVSESFTFMLLGRFLQGIGAAGPRIISVAIVRDLYQGRVMASIMSLVMGVFILVPAIAPALGQAILWVGFGWRGIFVLFLIMAAGVWTWFALRQPETLAVNSRAPFTLNNIFSGIATVCCHPVSLGYTVAVGMVSGAFVCYLSISPQIFADLFGITDWFALYFAAIAMMIGVASVLNSRLVLKYGMHAMSFGGALVMGTLSTIFAVYLISIDGTPSLGMAMLYFCTSFMCIGVLFGNLNALAMEPLGHIAGIGAAVVGSLSTLIGVGLGFIIGQLYSGTLLPLALGFAILCLASLPIMAWANRYRKAS